MKPQRFFLILCVPVFLAGFSCETSREQKPDAATAVEKPETVVDTAALVEKVEKIRDREFEAVPRFRQVSNLKPAKVRGSDAYVADRAVLEEVLFGTESRGLLPWVEETALAGYDPKGHVIRYQKGDDAALERALVFAIVEALNQEAFASAAAPQSWDAALAQTAARRGDAALSWVGLQAEAKGVGLETIAKRPEVALQLDQARARFLELSNDADIHDLEDAFVVREGFALTAALYRAGGWSAAELARIGPPGSTDDVVRPDRWLGEGATGRWKIEDEHDQGLIQKGWVLDREGAIGPGIVSIWLADKIDPNRSRSIYTSWQSDTYRMFRKDGKWWFEWISLWRTPSDATQVSGALNKGLAKLAGARYEVVDAGASVSVVGTSDASASQDLLLARATENTQILPVFEPHDRGMVEFVPTTLDTYLAGVEKSELDEDEAIWKDEAAKLVLSLEALSEWQMQKTDDPSARWVAKKDRASILMTTQLSDPFHAEYDSPEFEQTISENFKESIQSATTAIKRVDEPVKASIDIEVKGEFEGAQTGIRARIFKAGDVLVTLSLKGTPAAVKSYEPTFDRLLSEMKVDDENKKAAPEGDGIIEFKVEE